MSAESARIRIGYPNGVDASRPSQTPRLAAEHVAAECPHHHPGAAHVRDRAHLLTAELTVRCVPRTVLPGTSGLTPAQNLLDLASAGVWE